MTSSIREFPQRMIFPGTRYNSEGNAVHHVGPMAQDFHAAFGLGQDDVTIGTVDQGGITLAAIQGLDRKLDQETAKLKSQNDTLRAENATLRIRLEACVTSSVQRNC